MTRFVSAILLALLVSSAPLARAAEDSAAITIPAGSTVHLINTRVLWMKSAQTGDTLYLQVNEPLLAGDLTVIPAGSYVQATLTALTLPTKADDQAILHFRFDKLIFPNGYVAVLANAAPLARVTVMVDSSSDVLLDNGMWLHMNLAAPLTLDAQQVAQAATLSTMPGPFQPGTLCRSISDPEAVRTSERMPDITIPGNTGTNSTTTITPGGVNTLPGMPASADVIIPSLPGFPGENSGAPVFCPPPPRIRSTVSETTESASQTSPPPAAPQQPSATAVAIPAGVSIPLTLTQSIDRSSKIGGAIEATVASPVTVGSQLAIPAGTRVEGTITEIRPVDKKTHQPHGTIHITSMVYPSGYTIALDDAATADLAIPAGPYLVGNSILFHPGWQFQLTTQTALTIDITKISPALRP